MNELTHSCTWAGRDEPAARLFNRATGNFSGSPINSAEFIGAA